MAPQIKMIVKYVMISALFLLSLWALFSLKVDNNFIFGALFKKNIASATTHYGILGQRAPELDLTTWIDGFGNPIKAIRLSSLRGKVVYLYFFQDW